mgnify:CR=1 FL=1
MELDARELEAALAESCDMLKSADSTESCRTSAVSVELPMLSWVAFFSVRPSGLYVCGAVSIRQCAGSALRPCSRVARWASGAAPGEDGASRCACSCVS